MNRPKTRCCQCHRSSLSHMGNRVNLGRVHLRYCAVSPRHRWTKQHRSSPCSLNSFAPRDKEIACGLKRYRVVHGGDEKLCLMPRMLREAGFYKGLSAVLFPVDLSMLSLRVSLPRAGSGSAQARQERSAPPFGTPAVPDGGCCAVRCGLRGQPQQTACGHGHGRCGHQTGHAEADEHRCA